MRTRQTMQLLTLLSMIMILTACAAGPASTTNIIPTATTDAAPSSTFTGSAPASATPTSAPSETPTVEPTPEPSATSITENAPCFEVKGMPVAFFPDGSRVLVKAERGVQIYNLQAQEEESFIELPAERNMVALALSPTGQKLAWALDDNTIQLVPTSGKGAVYTISGHTGPVNKLVFSPDGSRLYSASSDTWIRVWDMTGNEAGAFQPTGALDFPADIQGIGLSPDGAILATIPFDGPVRLWDTQNFQPVRTLGATGAFITSDVVFSPDGAFAAADSATGLFLWKTNDGAELMGGNPGINSMAVEFSPDGQYLAYGEITDTNKVVITSPDGSKIIRTLEGSSISPIGGLLFSPDSSLLLAMDWVEVRVWRVDDGSLVSVGKLACP